MPSLDSYHKFSKYQTLVWNIKAPLSAHSILVYAILTMGIQIIRNKGRNSILFVLKMS